MVFDEEFIWYQDHFVYHIIEKANMELIVRQGLRPKCGTRSKSVGDIRKAIYFFDSLYSIEDWIENLYRNKDIHSLELLRFNLKRRKWKIQCREVGDFYLYHPVLPTRIEFATMVDENGMIKPMNSDLSKVKVLWKPLTQYNQNKID